MDFIVLNNFITKYDETGRAMLFISFDDDLIFWDISLPKKFKDMFGHLLEQLEMIMLDIPIGKSDDLFSKHTVFRERASQILDLIVYSLPDIKGARIPDYFLHENGDLDYAFIKKISHYLDFEPEKEIPYTKHGNQNFDFAYTLKVLILSKEKYSLEDVKIDRIDKTRFESSLLSFELASSWHDFRDSCEYYYELSDEDERVLVAFDSNHEPQFFFVLDNHAV